MPFAAKLTDKGTQHDGYHETVITAGSPTVLIDGLPAARLGDPLTPHDKPEYPLHPRKIASGSGAVFIDGLPAARTGDAIDCGGDEFQSVFKATFYLPVSYKGKYEVKISKNIENYNTQDNRVR